MKKTKRIVAVLLIMTLIMGLSLTSVSAEVKDYIIMEGGSLKVQYDTKDLALGNVKVGQTKSVAIKVITTESFPADSVPNARLYINITAADSKGNDVGTDLAYSYGNEANGTLEANKEYTIIIKVTPQKKGNYSLALAFSYIDYNESPTYQESGAVITLTGVEADTSKKKSSNNSGNVQDDAVNPKTADPIDYTYIYTLIGTMSLMLILAGGAVALRRRIE